MNPGLALARQQFPSHPASLPWGKRGEATKHRTEKVGLEAHSPNSTNPPNVTERRTRNGHLGESIPSLLVNPTQDGIEISVAAVSTNHTDKDPQGELTQFS
jgi:hypothetical protein